VSLESLNNVHSYEKNPALGVSGRAGAGQSEAVPVGAEANDDRQLGEALSALGWACRD